MQHISSLKISQYIFHLCKDITGLTCFQSYRQLSFYSCKCSQWPEDNSNNNSSNNAFGERSECTGLCLKPLVIIQDLHLLSAINVFLLLCVFVSYRNGSSYVTHSGGRRRAFQLNWALCWIETFRNHSPPPILLLLDAWMEVHADPVSPGRTDLPISFSYISLFPTLSHFFFFLYL